MEFSPPPFRLSFVHQNQAGPRMDPANTIVLGMFGALVCSCAAAWAWALPRLVARRPLLHYEPRRPVPWGFLDLFVVAALNLGVPAVVVQAVRTMHDVPVDTPLQDIPRDALAAMLLAAAIASVAAAAIGATIVALRAGAAARDFGIARRGIVRDVVTGVVAFVMLAAPVLVIQLVLTQWFPTKHPLIEIVRQSGSERFLWLTALSAVVVAPVVEEFLFRALLQGWLERAAGGGSDPSQLLFGGVAAESQLDSPAMSRDVESFAQTEVGNPNLAPRRWPIFVSAAIFAAMHLGHGPDPVPLFVLALGLGYVYQRTHRLLPCIVIHFLLNGWTMATMLVLLRFDKL